MIAFLGPAQAVAISPFCTLQDITAWSRVDRNAVEALGADAVWRQLLVSHFPSAFGCLGDLKELSPPPERLAAQLPGRALRELYASLCKVASNCPFTLDSKSRLQLEIPELREWDRHRNQFLMLQQAGGLAAAFADMEAADQLRTKMGPPALELISLQTMMGNGQVAVQLAQLEDVRWSQSAETDLRQLMEKRLKLRRSWWQKQREYLLQDLSP